MNLKDAVKTVKAATSKDNNLIAFDRGMISAANTLMGASAGVGEFIDESFAVDAGKLSAALAKFDDPKIEHKDGKLIVKSGRSRATIPTMPVDMVATFEIGEQQNEMPPELGQMIASVLFAAGNNDVRYFLNGVCVESDGDSVIAIATNGHMLAYTGISHASEPVSKIIPREAVAAITQHGGNIWFNDKANSSAPESSIVTNLIDGRYPDWRKAIPDHDNNIVVSRAELLDALGKVAVISSDKMQPGLMCIDSMDIVFKSKMHDSSESESACSYEGDHPEMEIGINVTYLIQAVTALSDTHVTVSTVAPDRAIKISDADLTVVVMPMRV